MEIETFSQPKPGRRPREPGPGDDALERAAEAAMKRPAQGKPPAKERPKAARGSDEFEGQWASAREAGEKARKDAFKASFGGKKGREAYSTPESENVLTAVQSGAKDLAELHAVTKGRYPRKLLEQILSRLEATEQITPEQRAKFKTRK
jgi:hypothetical protein